MEFTNLELRIQDKKDSEKTLFPELASKTTLIDKVQYAGILEGGTKSGLPSLAFGADVNGQKVILEITHNHFNAIYNALKGAKERWGV